MSEATSSIILMQYYLNHITKIYCTYLHLIERFSEIIDDPQFADLRDDISQMVSLCTVKTNQLNIIHPSLLDQDNFSVCKGLVASLEEAFAPVYTQTSRTNLRNVALLSYLSYSNSIELGLFRILVAIPENIVDPDFKNLITVACAQASKENFLLKRLLTT